jgi:hypothetical protein
VSPRPKLHSNSLGSFLSLKRKITPCTKRCVVSTRPEKLSNSRGSHELSCLASRYDEVRFDPACLGHPRSSGHCCLIGFTHWPQHGTFFNLCPSKSSPHFCRISSQVEPIFRNLALAFLALFWRVVPGLSPDTEQSLLGASPPEDFECGPLSPLSRFFHQRIDAQLVLDSSAYS